MPDGREIFSFEDVVASFDVERFSPVGPIFDIDKLDWLNAEYIRALSEDEFLARATPFLPGPGQEEALRVLAPELKTRMRRLKDVCEQVEFLYQGKIEHEIGLFGTPRGEPSPLEALLAVEAAVDGLHDGNFSVEAIESVLEAERERHTWKKGPFYGPVRVALTGKTVTPPNFQMLAALGRERSLARLRDAIALLTEAQ